MDADHSKREGDDLDIDLDPPSSVAGATVAAGEGGDDGDEDAEKEAQELAAMKTRVAEMEREAQMLRDMTAKAESDADPNGQGAMGDDEKEAVDQRSIYVGNVSALARLDQLHVQKLIPTTQVDYASTPEEIQAHFASCGTINRVTILFDKYTGPKGFVLRQPPSCERD